MKVWITKYALTYGIVVTREAKPYHENDKYIVTPAIWHGIGGGIEEQTFGPLDWHLSQEAAIRRANKMKELAIHRLESKLEKLTSMTAFTIVQHKIEPDQGGSDDDSNVEGD